MNKLNGEPLTKDEALKIAFMAYAAVLCFMCAFALFAGWPIVAHTCVAMLFVPSAVILVILKFKNRTVRRTSWTLPSV